MPLKMNFAAPVKKPEPQLLPDVDPEKPLPKWYELPGMISGEPDRRKDVYGARTKEFFAADTPTQEQARLALWEMNCSLNKLLFWMYFGVWWPISQRTEVLYKLAKEEKWKEMKAALTAFYALYQEIFAEERLARHWSTADAG